MRGDGSTPSWRRGNNNMEREVFIQKVARILNGATRADVKVILEAVGLVLEKEVISQYDRVQLFSYLYISGYEKPGGLRRNVYNGSMVTIPPPKNVLY
jgi:hypothetical protein